MGGGGRNWDLDREILIVLGHFCSNDTIRYHLTSMVYINNKMLINVKKNFQC